MRAAFARRLSTTLAAASSSSTPPPLPRAAVATVLFRDPPSTDATPHVLLVQRGRPPGAGLWSFAGGKLKPGETIVEGAARETREETGVAFCGDAARSGALAGGRAFTAVDSMHRDENGGLLFHYVIVEVAAVAAAGSPSTPTAADDAADAAWVALPELEEREARGEVTPGCAAVAAEAVKRFF